MRKWDAMDGVNSKPAKKQKFSWMFAVMFCMSLCFAGSCAWMCHEFLIKDASLEKVGEPMVVLNSFQATSEKKTYSYNVLSVDDDTVTEDFVSDDIPVSDEEVVDDRTMALDVDISLDDEVIETVDVSSVTDVDESIKEDIVKEDNVKKESASESDDVEGVVSEKNHIADLDVRVPDIVEEVTIDESRLVEESQDILPVENVVTNDEPEPVYVEEVKPEKKESHVKTSKGVASLKDGSFSSLSTEEKNAVVEILVKDIARALDFPVEKLPPIYWSLGSYDWPIIAMNGQSPIPNDNFNSMTVYTLLLYDADYAASIGLSLEQFVVCTMAHEVRHSYQAYHSYDDSDYGRMCYNSFLHYADDVKWLDSVSHDANFLEQDADAYGIEYMNLFFAGR